jgi:uncharacterized protein YozE (UPF0346 family)
MSGPKIDQAELERQRRAELERQRQERLRRIREETEKLNFEITAAKTQIDQIDRHLLSITRNLEHSDEMASTMTKLSELKTSYKAQLARALGIDVPAEPDAIFSCAQKLANVTKGIIKNFYNEVKPLEERMSHYIEQLENQHSLAERSKAFSAEVEEVKKAEDFDFAVKLDRVICSDIEPTVKERAEQILSEIEEWVNSESIQESDMKALFAIANNIYKTAFDTKTFFEAAAIEYQVAKHGIVRNMAVFDDIYQDYYAEYIAYLELINSGRTTPLKVVPKRKYRFDSIEELQNEIELIAEKSKIVSENKYIREQIDDVMSLFGYKTCEEIILDANQTGSHFTCENASGQSAIHVHISEKKQIMLEIVGIGHSTGADNSSSVTDIMIPSSDLEVSERDALLEEQGSFCSLHPKIVEELGKRGVILSEKSRKAPDIKYSKKIVHLSSGGSVTMNDTSLINDEYEYNENATKRNRIKKKEGLLRALK